MKINKNKLLLSNIILSLIMLVFFLSLGITLSQLTFPETIYIYQMDELMIKEGQASFLIIAVVMVCVGIPIWLGTLVTSCLVVYYFLFEKIKKSYVSYSDRKWYVTLGWIFFSILYLLLPMFFVWVIKFYVNKQWTDVDVELQIKNNSSSFKKNKILWISIITIIPILFISIFPILIGLYMTKRDRYHLPLRPEVLLESYKLSKNKPNTMILYFDRAYGLMFNQLLALDYFYFKEFYPNVVEETYKPFIELFPEFTSYVQTLSQSQVTNAANPLINGSWFMQPIFKNLDIHNSMYGVNTKNLTMDEWFLQSYKSSFGLMNRYGYDNISLMNAPYYGKLTWNRHADPIKLQSDLNESWTNGNFLPIGMSSTKKPNFNITDVSEINTYLGNKNPRSRNGEMSWLQSFTSSSNSNIVEDLSNYQNNQYGANDNLGINGKPIKYNLAISSDEQHGGITQPKLSVENNYDPSGSSFLFMQFQITHEPYMTITNKNFVSEHNPKGFNYSNIDDGKINKTNNDTDNFILSMWFTIQKLKRIFIYMKNLPANDESRPWIKNQYDNTNIYVMSDHGGAVFRNSYYEKINNYLIKKGAMTKNDKNFIKTNVEDNSKVILSKWNSVFMRKPALYSDDSGFNKQNTDNNFFKNFFELDTLVTDSDFFPIIESDLQRQIWNSTNPNSKDFKYDVSKSWYTNPETNELWKLSSQDQSVQKMINEELYDNFVYDPLNPNNKQKVNSRIFNVYRVTWRFFGEAKNYNIQYQYKFENKGSKLNIFNKNNYVKV